ncbi:MAG: Tad domain-containing protein [Pontiellaceae bacterium]|nr:Tad domain-containing protein [Pontiellaceae bacterium]
MTDSGQRARSGQAIILLMAVMVIGLLVVMWNVDLHRVVSTKVRVGNAGDASAQSAARWQGISMNMVGELNLIQAAVLLQDPDDRGSVYEIAEMRSRLTLIGPLMGFFEAQSVAFLNLSAKDRQMIDLGYSNSLKNRAAQFLSGGGFYHGIPEPYRGAWLEYGLLLNELAEVGVVVQCANTKWYRFYNGYHILLDPGFYNALMYPPDWCWFERTGNTELLSNYEGRSSWSGLPDLEQRPSVNSEYFGLGLRQVYTALGPRESGEGNSAGEWDQDAELDDENEEDRVEERADYLVEDAVDVKGVSPLLVEFNQEYMLSNIYPWHFYDKRFDWDGDFYKWVTSESGDFPFRDGEEVLPEFNYSGADAATTVSVRVRSYTPGIRMLENRVIWHASAKAFGYLETEQGRVVPHYFDLVLPAFHQARLIANGISSRTNYENNEGWEEHIYLHVPAYMENGTLWGGCPYCAAIMRWDNPEFREVGRQWLEKYGDTCDETYYVGPGGTGGSSDWR